jgi:ribonuclease Z
VSTAASPSPTRVTLLGTGSPLPTAQHAGPATLVHAGDAVLLVDCGRAVVRANLTAVSVGPDADPPG